MRTKIPRSSIVVPERFRIDYGDLTTLKNSIQRYGLIQPLVLNQNNILVAGGRRITACDALGLVEVDVVYRETLSEEERLELEIEENLHRKDFDWKERIFSIEKLHNIRKKRAALEGDRWGQMHTAELMGMSSAVSVNYSLILAEKLHAEELLPPEKRQYSLCSSMMDAWRLRMREEEEALTAANAADTLGRVLDKRLSRPACSVCAGHDIFCPHCEGTGYEPQSASSIEANSLAGLSDLASDSPTGPIPVSLTSHLHNGDCIQYMLREENREHFDHIITDPPYGISMDMLNQGNDGHAFKDIDTVLDEHEVEPNKALLAAFFPAAYQCLKPNSFCITWCDQMLWQYLYDLAIAAGFKVQRWPITWVKLHHCMNQSASSNFTKTTEIAMVCRKGVATMVEKDVPCHVAAAHDELKDELGHPFVKPFAVWEHLISSVSMEGQLILEPFAGRGSAVISLVRLKRHFMACESNTAHFNSLMDNLKRHYLKINPNFLFL